MKLIIPSDTLVQSGYYETTFPTIVSFMKTVQKAQCRQMSEFWVNQTTPTEKRLVLYIESEGQYIIYKLSDVDFLLLDAGKIICRINQVYYQLPWTIHNAVQFTQLSKCAALIKVKFTFRVSADLFLRLTQNTGTFRSRSNQKKI